MDSRVILLTAACLTALPGCARSYSNAPSGPALPSLAGKSGLGGTTANSAKTYSQYSQDYQGRSVVSPGMGLDNRPDPTVWQKLGASLTAGPRALASSTPRTRAYQSPASKPKLESGPPINGLALSKRPEAGPDLYVATAQVYEKQGNFVGAIQNYEKALVVAPNHLPTLLSYAHMLDRRGSLDQATEIYIRAVKSHAFEPAVHNDLGMCYARRGMLNEATRAVGRATELAPDRVLYRNNLAAIYIEQQRPAEALEQFKRAHTEAVAYYNVGYLLAQRRQEQLAAMYFNQAVQLEPNFGDAQAWADHLAARLPQNGRGNSQAQPPVQMASAPSTTARPGNYVPPSQQQQNNGTRPATYSPPTQSPGLPAQASSNPMRPAMSQVTPLPPRATYYEASRAGQLQSLPALR